jgi:hypothetical protein
MKEIRISFNDGNEKILESKIGFKEIIRYIDKMIEMNREDNPIYKDIFPYEWNDIKSINIYDI